MELKNKLTVTRGEGRGGQRGKEGKGSSRNMYKGPMDKAKGERMEGGRWGWVVRRKVVVEEWRQLYSNNNKTMIKI